MPKYRKKPVVIDAVQITDLTFDAPHPNPEHVSGVVYYPAERAVRILASSRRLTGELGDWIVTGVEGEKYLYKPDVFAATYEAVT